MARGDSRMGEILLVRDATLSDEIFNFLNICCYFEQ